MTDVVYALVQALHNFGVAAVLVLPAAALARERAGVPPSRRGAVLLAVAWGLLVLSGAGFGIASLTLKGALPEIEGVALWALAVKIGCGVLGVGTSGWAALRGLKWSGPARRRAAGIEIAAALVPLAAAAVLRWYL